MRSDGFFFFQCCSGNNDPTDLCHTICAIKIRSFVVFIPISEWKKKSPDLSCTVCAPMIRGILSYSLFRSSFFVFFCLFISNGIRRKKNLQIFRCSDLHNPIRRFFNTLDPTVFYHPRSDGFLALQIRRFFDFSPPNSPWIFDYQNQAGCGTRKIWTKFK